MTLRNRLLNWKTQLEVNQWRRRSRRSTLPRPSLARVHLERLEARLALSGFGPEDGAYIVENYRNSSYEAVKIQPGDQKIVAAGLSYDFGVNMGLLAIARYDSIGNPDLTFGSGGRSTPALGSLQETGYSLALQSDGKAVVAGSIRSSSGGNSSNDLGVARFNTDGSLDSTFSGDGWTNFGIESRSNEEAYAVGLQSNGKVVVAGVFDPFSGDNKSVVARFKTDGSIDSGAGGFGQLSKNQSVGYSLTTFGFPANGFGGLAVQPDDKIVAVGSLNVGNGTSSRLVVARYTASGNLDTSFNATGYNVFLPSGFSTTVGNEVSLQSDGKIIVAGYSTGVDGNDDMLVARFNSNGTLDNGFGGGSGYVRLDIDGTTSVTSEVARGVVIQPDGKIVVAGGVWAASRAGALVARFNLDGTPDSSFAPGGFKTTFSSTPGQSLRGYAVALQSDGTIIVAGRANGPETIDNTRPLLMRFSGAIVALAPAPMISSAASSTARATDTALTLLQKEDLTSTNLQKNSANAVQTGNAAIKSSPGGNVTPTVAALTNVSSPVQKSTTSKSGLGKISSRDRVLSLHDWFAHLDK